MEFYREIVEEPEFREQLYNIHPDPQLADEILDTVKIRLAQFPGKIGIFQKEQDVWITAVLLEIPFTETGMAFLYYTFDQEKVYLLAIEGMTG